jgi:acyl-CoA thioesterase-1
MATLRYIWYPLAAAMTAAACESSPALPEPTPSTTSEPIRRVVVLGDSLAVSPSLPQSFPAVLQSRVAAAGLRWTVTNAGVGGDTTADGLRRLEPLLTPDAGVLVLALGANDGLRGVNLSQIEQNLSSIIERAQARNVRVLLCGMETPPAYGWDYTLSFHNLFPRLAAKYRIPLVPFLLSGVAFVPELNGSDGVHPNAAGAQRIASTVWTYLEPMLRGASQLRRVS